MAEIGKKERYILVAESGTAEEASQKAERLRSAWLTTSGIPRTILGHRSPGSRFPLSLLHRLRGTRTRIAEDGTFETLVRVNIATAD